MTDSRKPRKSLSQRIADDLRRRILAGEFALGSCLPSERELAGRLGVSRQTIHVALDHIEAMGLVVRQPGRGTMVSVPARSDNGASRVLVASQWMSSNWTEHPRILRGVTDTLEKFGYQWSRHDDEEVRRDIDKIVDEYDGVVFIEVVDESYEKLAVEIANRSMPVTVANLERNDDLPVSHTSVDHAAITHAAVRMLVDFGHRRIGYVGYNDTAYFYSKMLTAYRAALDEAGIEFDPDLIEADLGSRSLIGYRGTLRMLMADDPPTALFAGRDEFAQGACAAIEERGLIVGRDISIIGYDDLSWPIDDPMLTTFHEPAYELGAEAVRMLVDRMIDSRREREVRILDAPLVLRRSAGPFVLDKANRLKVHGPVLAAANGPMPKRRKRDVHP